MSDSKERNSDFEPVTTAQEMLRFLVESAKTLSSTMIWTENQSNVIQTHVTMFSQVDKALYTWAPRGFNVKTFEEDLQKRGNRECFFSVSLPTANIFFKSAYLENAVAGLKFDVPKQIFKVQRRKHLRFTIPDGHVLRVEFQDPLFPETVQSRRVIDISAGGVSFLAGPDDGPIYAQGLALSNFHFTVKTKLITTEVEVRHVKPAGASSKEPGVKVGVIFKNMSTAHTQLIEGYVFEETRKYLSRFL